MFKILLIEDDTFVRFTLQKLLQCFGCKVITANDGNEGLTKLQKCFSEIEVVFCDIDMPFLNGFQLLQQLRLLQEKLPIFIFISAFIDANILQKVSLFNDVKCVIKKPVGHEVLKAVLISIKMEYEQTMKKRLV